MPAAWLERRTSRAPDALRARAREHLADGISLDSLADDLAAAGRRALERVVAHPGDRSVALDLLAADALVTLALLAQAERAPERLADFAGRVLRAGSLDA